MPRDSHAMMRRCWSVLTATHFNMMMMMMMNTRCMLRLRSGVCGQIPRHVQVCTSRGSQDASNVSLKCLCCTQVLMVALAHRVQHLPSCSNNWSKHQKASHGALSWTRSGGMRPQHRRAPSRQLPRRCNKASPQLLQRPTCSTLPRHLRTAPALLPHPRVML